jgi:hypothetical protein
VWLSDSRRDQGNQDDFNGGACRKRINGKDINGKDINGKDINGKDINGKRTNGKRTNGSSLYKPAAALRIFHARTCPCIGYGGGPGRLCGADLRFPYGARPSHGGCPRAAPGCAVCRGQRLSRGASVCFAAGLG